MTWLHSFLPTGAFQPDHHHMEKWWGMKLLFEYRRFHLDWALIYVRQFRPMDEKWGSKVDAEWAPDQGQIRAIPRTWMVLESEQPVKAITNGHENYQRPKTASKNGRPTAELDGPHDTNEHTIRLKTVHFTTTVHIGPDLKWQAFLYSWTRPLFGFASQQQMVQGWLSHDGRFSPVDPLAINTWPCMVHLHLLAI